MLKPSVSTCANPNCSAKFKRLGDGKLFTEPANVHERGRGRLMVWMCDSCTRHHSLRYDREHHKFIVTPHHYRGKRIA